jgi:hypothetical protein
MLVNLNPFCYIPASSDPPFPRSNPQKLLSTFPYALPPTTSYPYMKLPGRSHHHS